MSTLKEKFKAPDNKKLSAIANTLLYIAGPLGTAAIILARFKGLINSDEAFEYIATWASAIGGFKLSTKFTEDAGENPKE